MHLAISSLIVSQGGDVGSWQARGRSSELFRSYALTNTNPTARSKGSRSAASPSSSNNSPDKRASAPSSSIANVRFDNIGAPLDHEPYVEFDKSWLEARGNRVALTNVRGVNLRTNLTRAEELLAKQRPISLSCNVYGSSDGNGNDGSIRASEASGGGDKAIVPLHHALQVVLANFTILSFVFDAAGELSRCYIDDSATKYFGTSGGSVSCAIIGSNKLVMGMDNKRLAAIVTPHRKKSKRAYISSNNAGLLRAVDGPDRKPHALCFHPNGDHLCAAYYQQLCVFRWNLANTEVASPMSSSGGRTGSRKGSESKGSSVRSPTPEPRLDVTLSATLTMDRCRIMFVDWLPPPINSSSFTNNGISSSSIRAPNTLILVYEQEAPISATMVTYVVFRPSESTLRLQSPSLTISSSSSSADIATGGSAPGSPDPSSSLSPLTPLPSAFAARPTNFHVTACGRSPNRRRMLLGFSDGTLVLLSTLVDSITIIKRVIIPKKHEPRLIVWHSLGAIICVFFASGHMCVLDAALQRLHMVGEGGDITRSLDFTRYLPFRDHASHAVWGLGQPASAAHVAGGLTRAISAPPLPSLDGTISLAISGSSNSGSNNGSGSNSGNNSAGPSTPIPITHSTSTGNMSSLPPAHPLAGSVRRSLADSAATSVASQTGVPSVAPSSSYASRDWACLDTNTLAVMFDRGPLILLSFGVGGGRAHLSLRHRDIIAQRLATGEIEQCVQLLSVLAPPEPSTISATRTMSLTEEKRPTSSTASITRTASGDVMTNAAASSLSNGTSNGSNDSEQLQDDDERHASLVLLINTLLRQAAATPPSNTHTQSSSSSSTTGDRAPSLLKHISTIFNRFWPYYRSDTARYHRSVASLYLRFFHLLLRLDRPRRAYFAATMLATPQVFQELHNWAIRQHRYTLASLASNNALLTGLSPIFPTTSLIFATSAIAIPLAQADDEALWRANQRATAAQQLQSRQQSSLSSSPTNATGNGTSNSNDSNDTNNDQYVPTSTASSSSSSPPVDDALAQVRSRGLALEMAGELVAAMDLYRTFKQTEQQIRLQATIDAIQRSF